MNPDDDVEKLFSWLQTPDIHYREFAGAREIADVLPTGRTQSNTADNLPAKDEIPATAARQGEGTEPPAVSGSGHHEEGSSPTAPAKPTDQTGRPLDSVFNRLSGGRPNNGRPR
jgi:hypothetical protein